MRLEVAGYSVIAASNAHHALTFIDAPNDIVLVFSDIQMSGAMSGIGLAYYCHAHHESLLIILTSGVARDNHGN
jgi:DNA-binding NtrC family response regulator